MARVAILAVLAFLCLSHAQPHGLVEVDSTVQQFVSLNTAIRKRLAHISQLVHDPHLSAPPSHAVPDVKRLAHLRKGLNYRRDRGEAHDLAALRALDLRLVRFEIDLGARMPAPPPTPVPCHAGQYRVAGGEGCAACSAGRFSWDGHTSKCVDCPRPKTSNQERTGCEWVRNPSEPRERRPAVRGLVPAAAQTVVGNRGGLRLLKHGLGSGFATVMGAAAVLLLVLVVLNAAGWEPRSLGERRQWHMPSGQRRDRQRVRYAGIGGEEEEGESEGEEEFMLHAGGLGKGRKVHYGSPDPVPPRRLSTPPPRRKRSSGTARLEAL
jgi:hypothetical protein